MLLMVTMARDPFIGRDGRVVGLHDPRRIEADLAVLHDIHAPFALEGSEPVGT